MKRPILFFLLTVCGQFSKAQPLADTSGSLIPQKENIITASTIIKTENLGPNINTPLAELRPTVSADGNLLFFIVENDPMNTKYNSFQTRRISGMQRGTALVCGVQRGTWAIH